MIRHWAVGVLHLLNSFLTFFLVGLVLLMNFSSDQKSTAQARERV